MTSSIGFSKLPYCEGKTFATQRVKFFAESSCHQYMEEKRSDDHSNVTSRTVLEWTQVVRALGPTLLGRLQNILESGPHFISVPGAKVSRKVPAGRRVLVPAVSTSGASHYLIWRSESQFLHQPRRTTAFAACSQIQSFHHFCNDQSFGTVELPLSSARVP